MASEYAASEYRAVMLPDWRWTSANLWSTHSSYSQSSGRPGVPMPAQTTSMTLRASGVMAAGTRTLDLVALTGGMPGRTGSAGFAWRYDTDVAYRGWEPPHILAGWQAVNWTTSALVNQDPCIATLPSGVVLVATNNLTGGSTRETFVRARATAGTWGSAVTVLSEPYVSGKTSCPALCVLPNGRVLLFAWSYDTDDGTMTVAMYYSDDDGATWTRGSAGALSTPISTSTITPGNLRAAYKDGQILLVAWLVDASRTYADYLVQYTSSDLGATFKLVEAQADAEGTSEGYVDIVVSDGAFVVSYIRKVDLLPVSIRLGSAAHPISGGTEVAWGAVVVATSSAGDFTAGDLATAVDDRGSIWGYVRSYGSSGEIGLVYVSHDGGLTWLPGNGLPAGGVTWWWDSNDTDSYPQHLAACYQRGRVLLAHNWHASPGNEDASLGIASLGGSTTTTMPKRFFDGALIDWTETWLPFELPGNLTWTATGTASLEDLVSPGELQLQTSANVRYYVQTFASTIAQGIGVEFVFARTAGSALVVVRLADGVDDYEVSVFKDGSGYVTVYDENASQGWPITGDDTDPTAIRLFMANGVMSVWTRTDDSDEDREWELALDGEALTSDTGAPDANCRIQWGTYSTNGNHDVTFRRFSFVYGSGSKGLRDVAAGQTNPDDLFALPVGPLPTHLADGLYLSAVNGPAMAGDAWTLPVRYDYPIENLFAPESPSSTQPWRALSASDATIAVQLDTVADADFPSDIVGVYFDTPAAGTATLQIRTGGAWTTVGSAVDLTVGSLTYTRDGASVEITAGASYLTVEPGELVGQDFYLSSSVARRIAWNDGGTIPTSAGSTNRRVRLYLEDVVGTEPSSGTGMVVWPRSLAVFQLAGAKATGMRIVLSEGGASYPNPSQGYLSCGAALFGPVYPLGTSYEANRAATHQPRTDVFEATDGTMQAAVKGPVLREWALNWDLNDERPYILGTDDYVLASDVASAEPVGHRRDAARFVAGMTRQLDGPGKVFVYVPYLPHLSAASTILKLPRSFAPALCRTTGDLQVNTILGDEGKGEVLRFGMTFREEG